MVRLASRTDAVAIAIVLAASACATKVTPRLLDSNAPSSSPSETAIPSPSNVHEAVIPDWDHPFRGHGIEVPSAEEAQARVPSINVLDPRGLGSASIFVAPDNPPDTVIFVFPNSRFGQAWVVESPPSFIDDAVRLRAYQA